MQRLVDTSSQGSDQMTANLDKMTRAKTSFESIASVIHEANAAIGSIRDSVTGIVETGDGVKANMDAIARMSETSVNRLEEISSSVGELLNHSATLSSPANRLSAMTVSQEQVFAQLAVKEGS
jgi:methyl-accepting chemotaxis protein